VSRSTHHRCSRAGRRGGFTLIEAALATTIIGVGVMAMLQLLAAGTAANVDSAELTTGLNLAKNVREICLQKSFAELRAMDGATYSPPRDSRGQGIDELSDWTQKVAVKPVDPDRLTLQIIDDSPDALRVTATVMRGDNVICQTSWYAFDATP
jgi:Tfp pilus assembly protein PilV